MKILNVSLTKGRGGLEQVFVNYSRILKSLGNKVTNVVSRKHQLALIENDIGDYSLFNLNSFDPITLYQIYLILKKEKPDIIMCHGGRAVIHFTRAKKLFGFKTPIIAVCHSFNQEYLVKVDYLLALTEHFKQMLVKEAGFPEERIFVIPNFINITEKYKKPSFAKELKIGAIGRFDVRKGFVDLILALKILKDRGIDFKAYIGGDGEDRQNVEKKIAEFGLEGKVKLLGWVKDQTSFYDKFDLFCFTSHYESFGIVLLEAMLHSKAIISTDCIGPKEIIGDKVSGLLTSINNPEELADKIINLAEDKDYARKLSENGYKRLVENYSTEVVAKKVERVLGIVISR